MVIGCFRPNRSGRFEPHGRITRIDSSDVERDWMWLPEEILDTILSNLVSLHDYIRFGCVCKQWHSVATDQRQLRLVTIHTQVPFLLIPCPKTGILYNPARDKVLTDFKLDYFPRNSRLRGSSHGWLAFLKQETRVSIGVTLFNPFTRARISLPPILDSGHIKIADHDELVSKVVLSADPSLHPDGYRVAALLSTGLAELLVFIRPGRDKKWTHFTWGEGARVHYFPMDMLFAESDNSVYVIWLTGLITRVKTDHGRTTWEIVVGPWDHGPLPVTPHKYLARATSTGDLLTILLDFGADCQARVLKVQNSSLVEVEDLDGDAIFVGGNHAGAVAARDFEGIEADCVYYSTFCESRHVGKFNVKGRKFGRLDIPEFGRAGQQHPVWVFPTLNCDLGMTCRNSVTRSVSLLRRKFKSIVG